MEVTVLDIETETAGKDVFRDAKRVLSVQIGNENKQELYYADSEDPRYALDKVKSKIELLISKEYFFTGYFIRKFDVPQLKRFLDISIPTNKYGDLIDVIDGLPTEYKKIFDGYSLENVCTALGIECGHKRKMKEKAEQDGISLGRAILNSYNDFIKRRGSKDALFYQYAIGDVIIEYRLYRKLDEIVNSQGS